MPCHIVSCAVGCVCVGSNLLKVKNAMMPPFHRILATTALCLAAAACVPCYTGYGCSSAKAEQTVIP